LHAQIQREAEKRSAGHQGRSHDIKLGRGGIREIEFLAQMFQLMRGGDPRFRVRPTLQVLDLIRQRGILPADDVAHLEGAYEFLRRLEHRIQVWDDQQTHYLPDQADIRERLAISMGCKDEASFLGVLQAHQNNVARLFEKAFLSG
jgi:glutamate-ammonia-ligase adenylyltransferase